MPLKMKVSNISEYNENLKERGNIFHLFDQAVEKWFHKAVHHVDKCKQIYSDSLIEILAALRYILKYPYRQLEGFVNDYVKHKDLDLPVPDYTTLSRRIAKLNIKIRDHRVNPNSNKPIRLAIDSSGINIYHTGGGHSKTNLKGRKYKHLDQVRKIHIALDCDTSEAVAMKMTKGDVADSDVVPSLLDDISEAVSKLFADGAYDRSTVRETCFKREIEQVIPPSKVSVFKIPKKDEDPHLWDERNMAVAICNYISLEGRKLWKIISGYHERSLVEAFFGRFKMIFGFHFMNRSENSREVELAVKTKLLNSYIQKGAAIFVPA